MKQAWIRVALVAFLVGGTGITPGADIVYTLTRYSMAEDPDFKIVYGTLTTDGTTGSNLSSSSILQDWSITVTDGSSTLTHTPANSAIKLFGGLTITATEILVPGFPQESFLGIGDNAPNRVGWGAHKEYTDGRLCGADDPHGQCAA
jgi:hypothetical protein